MLAVIRMLLDGGTTSREAATACRANGIFRTVIIVTYDDNGGFWDHVAPPKLDRWGPGVRVPTVIVSPFAKRGFVDHTIYDTTSILKLIESRFDLLPLAERDANANGLANALELGQ